MKNKNTLNKDILNKGEGAERLLTRLEVAQYFSVSKESIRRWEKRGLITPIVINARVYRYTKESIKNLNCF